MAAKANGRRPRRQVSDDFKEGAVRLVLDEGGTLMSDVRCVSGVDLLADYAEGLLPPEVRASIEQHVLACERCGAQPDDPSQPRGLTPIHQHNCNSHKCN